MDKSRYHLPLFQDAPAWLSATEYRKDATMPAASLVLIRFPGEAHWTVATHLEANAIADPRSFVGDLLRPHAGLAPVWHVGKN